jgi:hypothetical protein
MSRRNLVGALALLLVFAAVALSTTWTSLRTDSREVVIGAQTTTVAPRSTATRPST